MQFQLSGQQIEVTPALRDHAQAKIDRLLRLDPKCVSLNLVISVDKFRHHAEGTLFVNGTTLHAEAAETDMYVSIDHMFDKLVHQLKKYREKRTDHHHHHRGVPGNDALHA